MKLSHKTSMIILIIIAFIFIGFGFFQMLFKINVNEGIFKYGQSALFILACVIYFNSRQKKDDNEDIDAIEDKFKNDDVPKNDDETNI